MFLYAARKWFHLRQERTAEIWSMGHASPDSKFVYVSYRREGYKDVSEFEAELGPVVKDGTSDIVIDLTGFAALSSPEIGVIVRTINALKGTHRTLRLISSPEVRDTLDKSNLGRLSNLAIYPDKDTMLTDLGRPPKG